MGKVWKRRWLATQIEIANAKVDTMIDNVSTIKASTSAGIGTVKTNTVKTDSIGTTGIDTVDTIVNTTTDAKTVATTTNTTTKKTKAKKGITDAS
jgi:hypothetical protein